MTKTIIITYESNPDTSEGYKKLIQSMDVLGLEHTTIGQNEPWMGFGCKILGCYNALLTLRNLYDYFVFVDSRDTFFQNKPQIEGHDFLISVEKNCWPDADMVFKYPWYDKTPWRFVNSGGYGGNIEYAIMLFEKYGLNNIEKWEDDQRVLTKLYLDATKDGLSIELDFNCKVFQCYSFVAPEDFSYENGLENLITGTKPSAIHGNGGTDMSKIYQIIPQCK